jgi:hypothetical protein
MKAIFQRSDRAGNVRIVATFGDAQLVRHINGLYELRGGSAADHTDAAGWISIFLHEAVVSSPLPGGDPAFYERTINVPRFDIRRSGRAASLCHKSRTPCVNLFENGILNCHLTNRKPLKDWRLQM